MNYNYMKKISAEKQLGDEFGAATLVVVGAGPAQMGP